MDQRLTVAFAADDTNETVEAVTAFLEASVNVMLPASSTSWPEMSTAVAKAVQLGEADYGVLMCWTGTGTAIAANKAKGVRAAQASDAWTAKHARLWNDANVLALSLKRLSPDVATECVQAFLAVENPDPEEAEAIAMVNRLEG